MNDREETYPGYQGAASRPPRGEGATGASREKPLYTELPMNAPRRTPPSGRPDNGFGPTRPGPARIYSPSGRSPASPPPRSGASAPWGERPPAYPPQGGGYGRAERSGADFTEISWESLRDGSYRSAGLPREPAYAPPPEQPYARPVPQDGYAPPAGAYYPREQRTAPEPYWNNPFTQERESSGYTHSRDMRARTGRSSAYPGTGTPPAYRGSAARGGAAGMPRGGGLRALLGRRGLHPAVYVAAFAALALLIFGVVRVVEGVRSRPARTNQVLYIPGSAVSPDPVTPEPKPGEEEIAETPAPTAAPTPEPTPTPIGPKAARSGNLIVPAAWGPAVPERVKTVYDSHFDKSIMIGNSLVEGFRMWSGMTNIRYVFNTGAVVGKVLGVMDLAPIEMNPDYYTDVYLMFGLNEVGTGVNAFIQDYKRLVDYIRERQPNANIYIVSVTPVTQRVDEDPNEVQTMERINTFNAALKEFCTDAEVWYLDIYSMLINDEGYLSAAYAYEEDGKHFEKSGYVAWANYMKTHYVDAALVTER